MLTELKNSRSDSDVTSSVDSKSLPFPVMLCDKHFYKLNELNLKLQSFTESKIETHYEIKSLYKNIALERCTRIDNVFNIPGHFQYLGLTVLLKMCQRCN